MRPCRIPTLALLVLVAAGVATAAARSTGASSEPRLTEARGRMVPIGDDVRLHLDCAGQGSPTVLIDGGAGTWSIHYRGIQDALAGEVRVCTYDRAGFGLSDPSPEPRTASVMADELHRLLHAAGEPAPFLLVGHSFGGYTARIYDRRYGGEIAGLLLLESAHPEQWERLPGAWASVEAMAPVLREVADGVASGSIGLADLPPWPEELSADTREPYERAMLDPDTHATLADIFENARRSAHQVPAGPLDPDQTLVVAWAENSYEAFRGTGLPIEESNAVWADLQRELLALSPSAIELMSTEGDHSIHLTDPAFVVAAIRTTLREVRKRADGSSPGTPAPGGWVHRLPERSDDEAFEQVLAELEAAVRDMDAERFVELFSVDIEQLDVNRRVRIRGREAWRAQTLRLNAGHEWMERLHHGRARVGPSSWLVEIEWAGRVKGEALGGDPGSWRDYRYTGLGLVELDTNGRIRRQLLYGDVSTLDADLGLAEPRAWYLGPLPGEVGGHR